MAGPIDRPIGRLRNRVAFLKPTRSSGDTGQPIPSYSAQFSRWAEVETKSADEPFEHAQEYPEMTHLVTCRGPLTGVTTDWRLTWKGRTLNILGLIGSGSRFDDTMHVICGEIGPSTVA